MADDASSAPPAGETLAFAQLLGSMVGDGLAICSAGRVQWANARLAALCGATGPEEIVGRHVDSLLRDAEARRLRLEVEHAAIPLEAAFADDACELWVVREALLAGDADAAGRLAALRAQLDAEVSDHEQLLSVVSHELRTPVTVIRGYNNLLLAEQVGPLCEEQRHFVEQSNKSCERLSHFIADLLDACGEVRGQAPVEPVAASLRPLLERILTFLRPLIDERELQARLDLADDALRARFDESRIEQVLTNLLCNAIRYSKRGGEVTVRTRSLPPDDTEPAFVEVSVIDDGPGVVPDDRERIFEPYVRAPDDERRGGLGLGLAICRRIVDAHGGTIRVEAAPGRGSCFVFTVPAAVLPAAVAEGR